MEEINSLQVMARGNNILVEIKMEEDYMRLRRHRDGDEYKLERRRERERERQ